MWDAVDDTDYSARLSAVRAETTPKYPVAKDAGVSHQRGSFPERYWNADFRAMLTVAEFARAPRDWREIALDPPPDDDETRREIEYLVKLAQENRSAERVKEIIAQNAGFLGYFLDLMMMTPASHPASYHLIKIACRVAELTMPFFKDKFNRARPSQLYPALMPPVSVSGHPSYPSGHSLTAHLIADCLRDVCPANTEVLRALADRISVNREIAGFHFPSDTAAGRSVAEGAYTILGTCQSFRQVVERASREWMPAAE
jgi:acid phosphatase (class A)